MNIVVRCVLVFFIYFCCHTLLYAATFDDFSSNQIDGEKWHGQFWNKRGLDAVREVSGGKLHTKFRVTTENTGDYALRAVLPDGNTIDKIQATTTVTSYTFDENPKLTDQGVSTDLGGHFYRDDNGDVYASVGMGDFTTDGNGLEAGCLVVDGAGNDTVGEFVSIDVSAQKAYTLSIQYDRDNNRFVCKIVDPSNGAFEEVIVNRPTPDNGPPINSFKALNTTYSIAGVSNGTFWADGNIDVTYDDVEVNGVLYDDFNSAPLDKSKWITPEIVRQIRDGQLHLNMQNFGVTSTTNDIYLLSAHRSDYFQADITISSDTVLTGNNTKGETRLYGAYYNYKYDGAGYNDDDGEVYAFTKVRYYSNGTLVPYVTVFSCDDASCDKSTDLFYREFTCDAQLDIPVTLAIEKKSSTLIFSCDQDQFSFELEGTLYDSQYNIRKFRSRVYSAPGEYGYLKATIDNVNIVKRSFAWNLFLPAMVIKSQK